MASSIAFRALGLSARSAIKAVKARSVAAAPAPRGMSVVAKAAGAK